jgi:hypothetical protein
MKNLFILFAIITALCVSYNDSYAQMVPVQGTIVQAGTNQPVPGLTVSLIHPALGRSVPAITNQFGQYFFYNIPLRPDPYYLEVYWGMQLIFRTQVFVVGPVQMPVIFL